LWCSISSSRGIKDATIWTYLLGSSMRQILIAGAPSRSKSSASAYRKLECNLLRAPFGRPGDWPGKNVPLGRLSVIQKDLGPNTPPIAASMTAFNPDKTWRRVTDAAQPPTEAK